METLLVDCVNNSLRHYMHRNAIFLCERLCADFPSEMDLLREAEAALRPANEPNVEVPNGAAGHYLLGLIFRYTDRRKSAVDQFMQALLMDPFLWAAYEELCILGAAKEASEIFGEAAIRRLQLQCPSFESSSQHSQKGSGDRNVPYSRPSNSEDVSPRQLRQLHMNTQTEITGHPHGTVVGMGAATQHSNCGPSNVSPYNTPSPMEVQLSGIAPPPLHRNIQAQPNLSTMGGEGSPRANAVDQAPRRKFMDEGKLRKVSGRLFSDSGLRRSTRLSGEALAQANSNAPQVGGNGNNHSSSRILGAFSSTAKMNSTSNRSTTVRKGLAWATESFDEGRRPEILDDARFDDIATTSSTLPAPGNNRSLERETSNGLTVHRSRVTGGALELLGLLRSLGEGYIFSCMYRCQDALEVYIKLSPQQYNTGWVLSQVGKAYFEIVDYLEADRAFSLARCASPYTFEGMDVYSTVLYHLKEEMRLSYLAQELISIDRLSPQAWCAIGNCYSLQKDHETALKNFQHAVQLDSVYTYAHTLCGHEYVAVEDYENGMKSYQNALQIDPRHYNAWYGLGMIYLRQEKFEFAEHHFRSAFQINPHSSVLMCYLGMALHTLKRNREALEMIEKSIIADKKNPLPMYQKANMFSLEKFDEALKDLEHLKECAPRESSVYALMGRIYKRLNVPDKAMLYFGIALDLEPSAVDVTIIKSEMEKLHVPEEIEDNL